MAERDGTGETMIVQVRYTRTQFVQVRYTKRCFVQVQSRLNKHLRVALFWLSRLDKHLSRLDEHSRSVCPGCIYICPGTYTGEHSFRYTFTKRSFRSIRSIGMIAIQQAIAGRLNEVRWSVED